MSKIKTLILAISILTRSEHCIADTEKVNNMQHLIHEIEEEAEDLLGGAIAIISNDELIYERSFGHKDINGSLVNNDTLFSLASVSKPIIATALAVLEEKGIVSFDDKILIERENISLKNILSHTTGYTIRGDSEIEEGVTRKELLSTLKKKNKKTFNSSKPYFYSNLMYSLTQEYAQKKGCKIDKLIKVLNLPIYTLPLESENLAYLHSKEKAKLAFPSKYQKTVPASAGVFASLNGMIEFLHIVLGNRPNILSRRTLDKMFEPVTKSGDVFYWKILPFRDNEVQSQYCLGWRKLTVKTINKSTLIFHSGYINGATAFVGIIPEHKVGIVILANQSSRFPLKNGLKLWKNIIESNNSTNNG